MSYMKENYQGLLSLTNDDMSVLTQNAASLSIDVDPYKRLIVQPLYDELVAFNVDERDVYEQQYWLQFHFESTVIDMSLEPSLTVILKPEIEEVEAIYLASPGLNLEGRHENTSKPTRHHAHINQLLAEWVEYLQERNVVIEGERPRQTVRPA